MSVKLEGTMREENGFLLFVVKMIYSMYCIVQVVVEDMMFDVLRISIVSTVRKMIYPTYSLY